MSDANDGPRPHEPRSDGPHESAGPTTTDQLYRELESAARTLFDKYHRTKGKPDSVRDGLPTSPSEAVAHLAAIGDKIQRIAILRAKLHGLRAELDKEIEEKAGALVNSNVLDFNRTYVLPSSGKALTITTHPADGTRLYITLFPYVQFANTAKKPEMGSVPDDPDRPF